MELCLKDFFNIILYKVFILLLFHNNVAFATHCDKREWFDSRLGSCIKCMECPEIVLRVCQPHANSVCGSFNDFSSDWNFITEKDAVHHYPDSGFQGAERNDLEDWNWTEISLVLAAIGCLAFFGAALVIMVQNVIQWRKLRKHFDSDMDDISAKLMARLDKAKSLEHAGNTIILNQSLDKAGNPVQFHCVYLEQILGENGGNHQFKKIVKGGNVYSV